MTVNAKTDSETGLRFYTWKGTDYPSVTSVRRLIGMPFTLHAWTLSKVVERAVVQYDDLGKLLTREARPRERALDTNRITEAKRWLRAAATEERDAAGDRGTRAHEAIASGLVPDSADADVRGYLAQFHDFLTTMNAKIVLSERQVWNVTEGYAGTLDAVIDVDHPNLSGRFVTDYKTSKGVYLDHAIQVMAYSMGDFVGENDIVDEEATAMLHGSNGMAVLHLSESNWELISFEPSVELFAAFTASLRFASFLYRYDNDVNALVSHVVSGSAAQKGETA